jgi:hypothetical protein
MGVAKICFPRRWGQLVSHGKGGREGSKFAYELAFKPLRTILSDCPRVFWVGDLLTYLRS